MNDNDLFAKMIGGGETKAQLIAKIKRLRAERNAAYERVAELESLLAARQSAPATPNHERSQLEALGKLRLVWVAGNEQYAAILKHGNLEVGHIIEKKRDSFLPWTWVASPSGYGRWSALAGAKTLDEAKEACEQYVRDELEANNDLQSSR